MMLRGTLLAGLIALVLALVVILWAALFPQKSKYEPGTTIVRAGTIKDVNIKDLKHLQEDIFIVYYTPGYERVAGETLSLLKQMRAIIDQSLGIQLEPPYSVALVPLAEGEGGIRVRGSRDIVAIPLVQPVTTLQDVVKGIEMMALFYMGLPHEAVEKAVARRFYHDRRARWIGDGLAEYAWYTVATTLLSPDKQAQLVEFRRKGVLRFMKDKNISTYNLIADFTTRRSIPSLEFEITEAAGYAVSLAFWIKLERTKQGIIRSFWQRTSKPPYPNAQEAARILSELTGEDIWAKLQNMDLHEVLQTLERAAQDK